MNNNSSGKNLLLLLLGGLIWYAGTKIINRMVGYEENN